MFFLIIGILVVVGIKRYFTGVNPRRDGRAWYRNRSFRDWHYAFDYGYYYAFVSTNL